MHTNSIDAYHAGRRELSDRAVAVYKWFAAQNGAKSDRECMVGMGFSDMNAVRPRITELVDGGHLLEAGKRVDTVTGRRVRVCVVNTPAHEAAKGKA